MVGIRQLTLFAGIILPWLTTAAPLIDKRAARVLPGKYIVTLKPGVSISSVDLHMRWVRDVHARSLSRRDTAGVEKVYNIEDFNAYAGTFDAATIAEIHNSEDVYAIEPDMMWELDAGYVTQSGATWGLGSISHRSPGSTDYIYHPSAGQGTYAYVIDSGIRTTHSEFQGRAFLGYNAIPDTPFVDKLGHGTHVAGTIGGKTYGVAKKSTLIAVRVFDSSADPKSPVSTIMDGYLWAIQNITNASPSLAPLSVINLSLGGPFSSSFNLLVSTASSLGVLTVCSAGNTGVLASTQSPASAPEAITVGAVDISNTRPDWSNYGDAVDIFAPGVDVLSAFSSGDDAVAIAKGTSMAAPHVSGLLLYFKGLEGVDVGRLKGWNEAAGRLKGWGTRGVVKGGGEGSPDLVAYNGNGA